MTYRQRLNRIVELQLKSTTSANAYDNLETERQHILLELETVKNVDSEYKPLYLFKVINPQNKAQT